MGRWLIIDPLVDNYSGWSSYNYTMDNPVKNIDPDGRGINDSTITAQFRETQNQINEEKSAYSKAKGFDKLTESLKLLGLQLKLEYQKATLVILPGPFAIESAGAELGAEGAAEGGSALPSLPILVRQKYKIE